MVQNIICVLGATGAQGGGAARALLRNGVYTVRAVTRNPDSEKAKALKELGADVVKADLNDVESLKKAFDGCYGAFVVSNFWEKMDPELEKTQLKNAADAAKAAGLKHVVSELIALIHYYYPR